MAKLKDLASPKEVLEAIRGGALKNEVIKKYKTSEQELAKLLLPLYRDGDLSKEEFNDFFKGVPLRPRKTPSEPEAQAVASLASEDDPPSAIVRSLAARPEPEQQEAYPPEPEKIAEEKEAVEEEVIEEGFLAEEIEAEVPAVVPEEEPILDAEPVLDAEPILDEEPILEEQPAAGEEPEPERGPTRSEP